MKSKKKEKAKRLRTKGPGRPLKKTHPRIKTATRVITVAALAVATILGLMVVGELAMLAMANSNHPVFLSGLAALKAGTGVADFVAKVIGLIALYRAFFKDRRSRR